MAGGLILPATSAGLLLGRFSAKELTDWSGWFDRPSVGSVARTVGEDIYRFFGSLPLLVGGTVILPAVVVGALVFLTRAWPRFLLVRAVAVMKRQLPWRLPEFLVDARARNIFRQ